MRRSMLLVAITATLAAVALPVEAVGFGWVPDSAGLPPMVSTDAQGRVGFIHPTRRLVAQQGAPGRTLLGHALFGLYQSASGGGWTSLTPNCLSLVRPPVVEDVAGLLSGCGVEGIATDPQNPLGLYVSTYNIDILSASIPVTYGGVFRSEVSVAGVSSDVPTAGLTWRKVLPGVRGNALAAKRSSLLQPATLVAGRIQRSISDVGTDNNDFCRNVSRSDNCSPSVYVSTNDGDTWTPKYFEPAPCSNNQNNVFTSSRIVGNLAFDPVSSNVVYAAANSGLWVSTDSGGTWSNALAKCGTNAGFAITQARDGSGAQRVYVGTFDSKLYRGTATSSGAAGVSELTLIGDRIDGQILSVLLDARDRSERTLFVASWTQPSATGGGAGGIYKVRDLGNTADVERLDDSLLDFTKTVLPSDVPLPYPLVQDPRWRPSLFLAQNPLAPDLLSVSTVLGGVWIRSDG